MFVNKLQLSVFFTTALVLAVVAGLAGLLVMYLGGGLLLWLLISFAFIAVQFFGSPILIKMMTGAQQINSGPVYNMVKHLAEKAQIDLPEVYVVPNQSPNAFAFGSTKACVAVHEGLLKTLNEEEVEAVIAHELGHIKHKDVYIMTFASALPVILYFAFIAFSSRDSRDGGGIGVFLGAIVARVLGELLVLFLSRIREYNADEFAARLTKNPKAMISALAKISYFAKPQKNENPAMSAFYISNGESTKEFVKDIFAGGDLLKLCEEEKKKHGLFEVFMTHPLTAKRIESLMKLKLN